LFMVAAAAVWRVSLVFPTLEALFALVVVATRGADRALRDWMLATAMFGSAGFALLAPMRAQHFVMSGAWGFVVATAVACALPWARRGSRAWGGAALVALVVAAAFVVARRTAATPY